MIEGISGVINRIQEINGRIEEIKSLGKNKMINPITAYTAETNKENETSGDKTQTFSEILKLAMEENGTLPGLSDSAESGLSGINSLVGTNNDSKALLELLYKNLKNENKGSDIQSAIEKASSLYHVDQSLIKAVIQQESGFERNALSPKGAMGLMQIMPKTADLLGISDPYDVQQNIMGGTRYLKMLMNKYGNDLNLALAAYNAGPDAVDKYNDIPPFGETQNYVRNTIKYYNDYKNFD